MNGYVNVISIILLVVNNSCDTIGPKLQNVLFDHLVFKAQRFRTLGNLVYGFF